MKRSELTRKTPLRSRSQLPPASKTRRESGAALIRAAGPAPVSVKRARQLRAYSKLRREFLETRLLCESPANCGQPATEVQHRRGRRGERLLDTAWWAASCRACNERAETDTGWALATGWLVRIEGDAA